MSGMIPGAVRVYRYQHSVSGVGPYNHDPYGSLNDMCLAHDDEEHPPWQLDGPTVAAAAVGFGPYIGACPSREALDEWFDGWQDELAFAGFVVAVYEVSEAAILLSESGKQCAFRREEGKRVG